MISYMTENSEGAPVPETETVESTADSGKLSSLPTPSEFIAQVRKLVESKPKTPDKPGPSHTGGSSHT